MTDLELGWLAGILEGEGSFMKGPPSQPNSPILCMASTDEDVVAKIATIFEVSYGKVGEKRRQEHWKTAYSVRIRGKRAMEWMKKLQPLMSQRRQAQIQAALDSHEIKHRQNRYDLTVELIQEIRLAKGSLRQIGKRYGIHHSTIEAIQKRRSYNWVL